ncbi:MAG: hypothetical protein L6R38_005891 [Xanthoria sp. 2 TBL-2021]|nr:MAG: hypothetical protein L6R38_005891 [Xanthoria sp. 2 TBL-2021]
MDVPRLVVLVILLLILFASPDTQSPSPSQQRELDYRVTQERYALDLLNTSSYGDLNPAANKWVNETGLRKHDGYAWDFLPNVQERARQQRSMLVEAWIRSNQDKQVGTTSDDTVPTNATLPGIPFYHNVTGIVHGRWVRSSLEDGIRHPILNLTALVPRMAYTTDRYTRNMTGSEGGMLIRFDEKQSRTTQFEDTSVREITAELTLEDNHSGGNVWQMTLHGVHYPQDGSIILTTTGPRFAGIFALPYFALSSKSFTLARKLLTQTLDVAIKTQERASETNALSPWSSSPESPSDLLMPTPSCEYLLYLQQHPIKAGLSEIEMIEAELRDPTGRRDMKSLPLQMSAVVFSPDCGFVLESKGPPDYAQQYGLHLQGPKLETYIQSSRRAILALGSVICGQIFLLLRQMREASTPSTKSRISLYTIGMLAMGDGFISFSIFIISLFLNAAFLPLVATAFLAFFSAGFLGMKFWTDIWTVQRPERQRNERRRQQEGYNAANNASQALPMPVQDTTLSLAGADTLPLPVTAPRSGTSTVPRTDLSTALSTAPEGPQHSVPGDQSTNPPTVVEPPRENAQINTARLELSSIYARFYFVLVIILLFTLHSTTWPSLFRTVYVRALSASYLSFLTPQIYRNIIRNCRKALQWRFLIGQSILRSLPFAYFYLYRDNVLFVEADSNWMMVLVGWLWFQMCILISQELFGPRFLVPQTCSRFIPVAYDYHPILREEDEESGGSMPIGFTQASTSAPDATMATSASSRGLGSKKEDDLRKDKKTFDCAICMQGLEVSIVPRDAESQGMSNSTPALGVGVKDWIFGRRAYMVTPCRHIFHSVCLESWMRYRLQCPICRDDLPPL